MKNDVYLLLICFAVSIGALAWVGWGLHDANVEIARIKHASAESDKLSLSTIDSLQKKLGECQQGNYQEKVDTLPAPAPKKVEEPPKAKAPSRRYPKKRSEEKAYEYQRPHEEGPGRPWGAWGLW